MVGLLTARFWGGTISGPLFAKIILLNFDFFAYSPMGPCPELTPGGGVNSGINPWGYMRGNTVNVFLWVSLKIVSLTVSEL